MKLTPEELQNIADDTQNLAPATFMKGRAKGPEVKLPPPQPAQDPWIPLADVLTLINHPNFHWCVGGLEELKYIELRIDTRDNCCLVTTRNGKQVDMAKAAKALESPYLKGMNENPAVEVHSKETMDEVRKCLSIMIEDVESEGIYESIAHIALAKLNPPQ